ncbi:uncharacterized protein LOC144612233 [Rhinoraja longicauda]
MSFGRGRERVGVEANPQSVVDGHLLLEKFETPFLYNTVLAEASDAIKQVSVTLDVETAHAQLEVSEDRKRVRLTGTRRSLPDTGKRFTDRPCVLGSEGFTSGRHYWEVEVAGSESWSLGVAAESVERKRWVTLTPETGVWSIRRGRGDEFVAFTSPPSPLPARPIPGRVGGVYLSYESGTVSFYDAATKSHLHTFTGNKFTEKLYPFFWPWDVDHWLRICSGSAPEKESKLHCEKHQEELKLFCETDKKLICVVCAAGREHKSHSFMPVDEAVEIYKDQVESSFESLTEKKSDIEYMEQRQEENISGVQEESHNLQSQITSQFAELHQILTEKEQCLLGEIQEEEKKIVKTMEKNLQEIQENLKSIQEELSKLQEQIDHKDGVIFLKVRGYTTVWRSESGHSQKWWVKLLK